MGLNLRERIKSRGMIFRMLGFGLRIGFLDMLDSGECRELRLLRLWLLLL